jgi:hypothetical protein
MAKTVCFMSLSFGYFHPIIMMTEEPTKKCLYHRTVYALRENSSSVICERHPSRVIECAVPFNGKAKPPYNIGNKMMTLDLCYKHYRVVDYIRGAEGARTPKKSKKNTL